MHSLLTVRQAAQLAQVAPYTLRRWIRLGRLPASRPGGRDLRIDERDLLALLERTRTAPAKGEVKP